MKVRYLLALTVALAASATALAADNEKKQLKLFKDGNCSNCHHLSEETVGPTLIQIADKYRGDSEAQAKLEKKVRNGGSGSWGMMPMPGTRPSVTDQDIKILVAWILEQKAKPKEAEKSDANADNKAK